MFFGGLWDARGQLPDCYQCSNGIGPLPDDSMRHKALLLVVMVFIELNNLLHIYQSHRYIFSFSVSLLA